MPEHPTFRKILVAVDDSPAALCALDLAREMASGEGSVLLLCSVVDRPAVYAASAEVAGVDPAPLLESLEAATRTRLDDAAQRLSGGCSAIEQHLGEGSPSAEIIAIAKASRADLIVMGTHGRRGVRHLLLGSVAEEVVRRSPVPVLTVNARCDR
jgi:nucleotide-binding universal stress UspA family protein